MGFKPSVGPKMKALVERIPAMVARRDDRDGATAVVHRITGARINDVAVPATVDPEVAQVIA